MKSKTKTRIIIILCILLVVIYIGFKYYCFLKFDEGDNLELSNVKITDKMTINHIDLDDSEYVTFENMKFKNIFEGYERFNEETDTYKMVFDGEQGEASKAIFIGIDDQFVSIINSQKEYKDLSNNVIKKENIKDDLDFIKYMEKHNEDNVKFFMSAKKQKQIYLVNEFKIFMLPSILYVKEIDGYFRGYIFKTHTNISEINILKGNKKYYFTFFGDYTDEFINDFMNSVVIE